LSLSIAWRDWIASSTRLSAARRGPEPARCLRRWPCVGEFGVALPQRFALLLYLIRERHRLVGR
jgi:hypothetical protein